MKEGEREREGRKREKREERRDGRKEGTEERRKGRGGRKVRDEGAEQKEMLYR